MINKEADIPNVQILTTLSKIELLYRIMGKIYKKRVIRKIMNMKPAGTCEKMYTIKGGN